MFPERSLSAVINVSLDATAFLDAAQPARNTLSLFIFGPGEDARTYAVWLTSLRAGANVAFVSWRLSKGAREPPSAAAMCTPGGYMEPDCAAR